MSYFIIEKTYELYFVQLAVGIASGLQSPAFDATFGSILKTGEEAKGWGLYATMWCFGVAISAFVGAQLVHFHGYFTVFSFMVLMNLVAFLGALFLPKRLNQGRSHFPAK